MAEPAELWDAVEQAIRACAGNRFKISATAQLQGGNINHSYRVESDTARYFVKTNAAKFIDMFEAEFFALREISASNTIRVPAPLAYSRSKGHSFLVLEYLNFSPAELRWGELGERLAALHACTAPQHGWNRHNTIGTTPQKNPLTESWADFWRDARLAPQLHLAAQNSAPTALLNSGEKLLGKLDRLFDGYQPAASLLHGDLWRGNVDGLAGGSPVIYDPACYYGDRETDIAMSELFGGFDAEFYASYRVTWPLAEGYERRADLYRLYHRLNHFNLFGGNYALQSQLVIDRLIDTL